MLYDKYTFSMRKATKKYAKRRKIIRDSTNSDFLDVHLVELNQQALKNGKIYKIKVEHPHWDHDYCQAWVRRMHEVDRWKPLHYSYHKGWKTFIFYKI